MTYNGKPEEKPDEKLDPILEGQIWGTRTGDRRPVVVLWMEEIKYATGNSPKERATLYDPEKMVISSKTIDADWDKDYELWFDPRRDKLPFKSDWEKFYSAAAMDVSLVGGHEA